MEKLSKRILPIAGTSAASTAFCSALVAGPDGEFLFVDGNGKITWENGTLAAPKPNALSLLHVADCPGSTPTCRASCYVNGLMQHAGDTYDLYRHNSQQVRRILARDAARALEWAAALGDWIAQNAPGGFRWHVSGDVVSRAHAEWIVDVCRMSPKVAHWIYTRSFEHAGVLVGAENLAVNLSADRDNWEAALAAWRANPGTRICYMTTGDGAIPEGLELAPDAVIFPDYNLRAGTEAGRAWFAALPPERKKMTCPVDMQGKSEERRCGPCPRCLYPSMGLVRQ